MYGSFVMLRSRILAGWIGVCKRVSRRRLLLIFLQAEEERLSFFMSDLLSNIYTFSLVYFSLHGEMSSYLGMNIEADRRKFCGGSRSQTFQECLEGRKIRASQALNIKYMCVCMFGISVCEVHRFFYVFRTN
jgi:hypothetical protein